MQKIKIVFLSFWISLVSSVFLFSQHHTQVVVLPNGNYLKCGGVDLGQGCQIHYSSSTSDNEWVNLENILSVYRTSHTMNVLGDGRVIVIGGASNSGTPQNSIDILNFDYNTGAYVDRTTINMSTPRANHTSTLLTKGINAGNVLICGGNNDTAGNNVLNTCEIFISSSNQIIPGPSLSSQRRNHSANILPSGNVLFVGGFNGTSYNMTTDIYYATSNIISPGPSIPIFARAYHSATTLANGNTIIFGGYNGCTSSILCPDPFSKDDSDTQEAQRQGTQGYLDDIVVLDENGAIVQINNNNFIRMPYRISNQTSLLHPSGKVYLIGGRGNIAPSYHGLSITLKDGSNIQFNTPTSIPDPTSSRRVSISTGIILFEHDLTLSRPVSGRIVEGDLFISPPEDPRTPSIATDNLEIYLKKTTAPLDGIMIDPTATEEDRGKIIDATFKLDDPSQSIGSYAVFRPISATALGAGGNFEIYFDDNGGLGLDPGQTVDILNTSIATITFTFNLPKIYIGYSITSATITITGGTISNSTCTVTLSGGIASTNTGTIYSSPDGKGVVTLNNLQFSSLSGTITNSTDTPINSPQNLSGGIDNFSFNISFTVSGADIGGLSFTVGKATAVIRDIIFSDIAIYKPKTNDFNFEDIIKTPPDNPPVEPIPVFDHSSIISKSNNIMIIGGQNCIKGNLSNNCRRPPNLILEPISLSIPYSKYAVQGLNLPKLNKKRANHTATVLTDGSILVCGGTDGTQILDSCELYDRRINEWIIISTMTIPRAYHKATLLPNGNVLISGGQTQLSNTISITNTSEIYYPSVRKFVRAGSMNTNRMLHTQTLLHNGNVLVTGGVGGTESGNYLNSAEIFITTANLWISVSNLNYSRSEHTATLLKNGNVFIAGGINGTGSPLNTTEIFVSTKNAFDPGPNLLTALKGHSSSLLKSGDVIIAGGTNGLYINTSIFIYNPTNNSIIKLSNYKPEDVAIFPRTNHKTILLPNGNIILSGGFALTNEGLVRSDKQLLTYDWIRSRYFQYSLPYFGSSEKKVNHSVVITTDNYIVEIGGNDDAYNYLNTVYQTPIEGYIVDEFSKESIISRKPEISSISVPNPDITSVIRVDRGEFLTLKSSVSNLHSLTDASGGGAGPQSSDFSKPSIYLKSINEDFIIDLSTMFFSTTTLNPNYQQTLSTITVQIPTSPINAPYGWYYLYDCVSGICSNATVIQISTPRPNCEIQNLSSVGSPSTTTIVWQWTLQNSSNANGFGVFSQDDVFITTVSFPTPPSNSQTYTQTGLLPNTPSSIKVGCYNIGGFSDPSKYAVATSTIYTKANPPKNLEITYASFDTISLKWDPNGNNPDYTPYQVEITTCEINTSYCSDYEWFPIMSFNNNYKKTDLTIRNLDPNQRYYFRVKARNGNGIETCYNDQTGEPPTCSGGTIVSTITVGNIISLNGTPLSPTSIKWSWKNSEGATGYEVYEYRVSTHFYTKQLEDVSVFLASTTYNYYTHINLSTNTPYAIKVRAYKQDSQTHGDLIYGPFTISDYVYTLSATPAKLNNTFTLVSTGSFKVNWDANGNPDYTKYRLDISPDPSFTSYSSLDVNTDSNTYPSIYAIISGLKPNYPYYVRVYSINKSNILNPTPAYLGGKYTLADAVKKVFVKDVSLEGVKIEWDPGENSPLTVYQVRATSVSFETPYVSTPIPLSSNYTDTKALINGLWINTTYWFEVTARNMEGILSPSIQTVDPVLTPGVRDAPPSAIAGVAYPDKDTEIKGILYDNREITLTILKETFRTPQPIAIAKLNENKCGYTFGGSTITFGFYAYEQPNIPIKFEFNYFANEATNSSNPPDINTNKKKVVLARYNPQTGQCLPVKTEINEGLRKITAELNHLSIYQLIIYNADTDLNKIEVFPNPFYPNRSGQGFITITNVPEGSKVKIYTLSGQKVYETKSGSQGIIFWDAKNMKGQYVGSGVYLCYIEYQGKSVIKKIAIER